MDDIPPGFASLAEWQDMMRRVLALLEATLRGDKEGRRALIRDMTALEAVKFGTVSHGLLVEVLNEHKTDPLEWIARRRDTL